MNDNNFTTTSANQTTQPNSNSGNCSNKGEEIYCGNYARNDKNEQDLTDAVLAKRMQVFAIVATILWIGICCILLNTVKNYGGTIASLLFAYGLPIIIFLNIAVMILRKEPSKEIDAHQVGDEMASNEYKDDDIRHDEVVIKRNGLEFFEKYVKFFSKMVYFVIICEVLLFLVIGVDWLIHKASGAGMVVALFYTGPIIIMNTITTILFVILSILAICNKKHDPKLVATKYKKGALLFIKGLLVGVIANLILFV